MTMPASQSGQGQPEQAKAELVHPDDRNGPVAENHRDEDSGFDSLLQRYHSFLRGQRGLAENTVRNYLTDLGCFRRYLREEELKLTGMDRQMLRGYLAWPRSPRQQRVLPQGSSETGDTPGSASYASYQLCVPFTVFWSRRGCSVPAQYPRGAAFRSKWGRPFPSSWAGRRCSGCYKRPRTPACWASETWPYWRSFTPAE